MKALIAPTWNTLDLPATLGPLEGTEVSEAMRRLRDRITWLEEENARLQELSHHDELTGLQNRRGFMHDLERAIDAEARYGGVTAILLVDLDGMKRLNDTCGHPAGDDALRAVGRVLRASLRGADAAARLGGDEFAVVLPSTGLAGAEKVAERLRVAIGGLAIPRGLRLTASIGAARVIQCDEREATSRSVLQRADEALYRAKRAGGDRVELDPERRT